MAPALQCPACGFKHRLDAVADTPVFPCARCSRQLKVPSQYRTEVPADAAPRSAPRGSGGGSGATTSTRPAAGRPRTASGSARPRVKDWRPSGQPMRLPVRILLWVIAFILSALIVRSVAKWTGIAGSQQVLDSMIDDGFGTYFRLFLLVPIWGLFATLLATVFIDGPRWWAGRAARRSSAPASPLRQKVPASARGAGSSAAPVPTADRPAPRKVPTRSAPRPAAAAGAAGATTAQRATRQPASPAKSPPPVPAADQRPRRIPRRETGS